MSKLIPDYVFDSIYDITPEVLTATAYARAGSIWTAQGLPQGCSAADTRTPLSIG